jgi:hypothetical protein
MNVELTDTQRKDARGGESPRLRDMEGPLEETVLGCCSRIPWNPSSFCFSVSFGADVLNCRSVYGLAVAAAWFLYSWCKLCGVAAPGLLLGLINPPLLSMAATSSAHKQTGELNLSKMRNTNKNTWHEVI